MKGRGEGSMKHSYKVSIIVYLKYAHVIRKRSFLFTLADIIAECRRFWKR